MKIKLKLKQLREESAISLTSLAEFLGIDENRYVAFENGTSMMSVSQIEKICCLFQCSEAYLFGRSDQNHSLHLSFANINIQAEDLETIASINKMTMNLRNMN